MPTIPNKSARDAHESRTLQNEMQQLPNWGRLHDPFQLHIGVDRDEYRRADNQQILFKQNGENFVDAGKGGKSSNIVVQDAAKKLCPGAREFSRPPQLA